jgi:hypothetical protein
MPSNYSFIVLTLLAAHNFKLAASLSFDLARSPQPAARSPKLAAHSLLLLATPNSIH